MTVFLVGAGGLVVSALVLAVAVVVIGRVERRAEAAARDALRSAEPPVLGGADRPRHLRHRRWT